MGKSTRDKFGSVMNEAALRITDGLFLPTQCDKKELTFLKHKVSRTGEAARLSAEEELLFSRDSNPLKRCCVSRLRMDLFINTDAGAFSINTGRSH